MFKKYIQDIVETEVIRLCDDFDKSNELVSQLNDVIHQQNAELSKLYTNISSLKEENLKLKNLHSKEKLEKNKLLFNGYGEKYEIEKLKRENEALKQDSEEVKMRYNKISEENKQLKNFSCHIVIDNDGKLGSLFNKQLRKENEQLKEAIENLDGKLILKGNLLSELKQENEKLKEKIYTISNQVSSYNTAKETGDLSFFSLMCLINDIENILKES